jgi:hypothetical protein
VNSMPAMNLFLEPFMMWGRLAWKAGEMAVSSTQVIGQRTGRFMYPATARDSRDPREFVRMGQEKVEATLESAQSAGIRALALNSQLLSFAFNQAMSVSAAFMSIAASRSPEQLAGRQLKLAGDLTTGSVVAASKLSGATARIARSAMVPVQKRVKKNVRRLARR